jgi:hypothetical protein
MAVLVERPLEVTSNSDGLVDLIGIGIETDDLFHAISHLGLERSDTDKS